MKPRYALWVDVASTATRVVIDDGARPRVDVHEGLEGTALHLPIAEAL